MGNIPITARVLKSSSKGMKVREPLLDLGSVANQTKEDVNLSGKGGTATIEEQIIKEQQKVSGGNKTVDLDEAKNYGEVETDMDKYFKDLYTRFGNDATTDELVKEKYISETARDKYDEYTKGKNIGVKQPDVVKEVETKKDVITDITPGTEERTGMSNFDARQQGRKSLQNERKLKRQKIKNARAKFKAGAVNPDTGKTYTRKDIRAAKQKAKLEQSEANLKNFQNMSDNISEQTAQGGSGTSKFTAYQYVPPNKLNYTKKVNVDDNDNVTLESTADVVKRVQEGEKNNTTPSEVQILGREKASLKDVIKGIGDNLVGDKSMFAKREGGTDVGNTLRAINPFNKKKKVSPAVTEALTGSIGMKVRKPLKKNFFNK